MYKAKLWDEDKWDIHAGYGSSKYGGHSPSHKKETGGLYNEQKYGSEGGASSDYMRKEDSKEKDDEKKKDKLAEEVEEKKEKAEMKDEEIPFRAASQIFSERQSDIRKQPQKKDKNTIEDAIKKAVEEEKKVVF